MSLLGSILSNLLLVLGLCFIAGGLRYKTQNFNAVANKATSSVLFLAVTAIVLPVAASHLGGAHDSLPENFILDISRGTAIVVMVVYLLFVFFQLYTHVDLFVGGGEGGEDGGGEAEVPMMSAAAAMGGLAAVAVLVAACSEFLTGSIEAVSESTGFSPGFLGMIVLPIAGRVGWGWRG